MNLHALNSLLGLDSGPLDLTTTQVIARGVVVFVAALVMVRLGDKRFLSKKTAFDAILGFILASMLARAINGSGPFWPTLAGGAVLVALHRLIALICRHWHGFGMLVKGRSDLVIRDGVVVEQGMRCNDLTEHDLHEELRLNGVERPEEVKIAYVERSGDVSVVRRPT